MSYAVSYEIRDRAMRRRLKEYLDSCEMESPEAVARFFCYYTFLIWDYLEFGEIFRMYTDDVVMHYGGGQDVHGLEAVIRNTMQLKKGMTFRYKHMFTDIFAEGDCENGYHFVQSTSYCFPDSSGSRTDGGGKEYYLPQGLSNVICECDLKKENGRWIIKEEWMC